MALISLKVFGGEVPRLTKRDLPNTQAQVCENLLADTPEFRPLNQDSAEVAINGLPVNTDCLTLYRYPTGTTSLVGLNFPASFVRSPISNDQYDRVYVSAMAGAPELVPSILSPDVVTPTPVSGSVRRLGVPYPKAAPTLSVSTVDQAFLTPSEAGDFKLGVLDKIRTITFEAMETVLWNDAFGLATMPAFREDPANTGKGIYQRIYTNTTPASATPTWNTYNGTPVANHLWTLQATRFPYVTEGSSRTFYFNFQAKVNTLRVKADVTAQTNKLKALLVPGTTDRLLSDADITSLWAAIRAAIPDNPLDTVKAELKTLLNRYMSEYRTLVNYLDQGFGTDVTPATGYAQVTKAAADLQGTVDGIVASYNTLLSSDYRTAVLNYFNGTITGNLPEGETPVVETRYYTYTLVSDRGEESRPYIPATGVDYPFIEVNQAQGVTFTLPANFLTLSDVLPTRDYITKWRLYRSATGTEATTFQLVAELPVAQNVYVDLRRTESLNDGLQTLDWDPPPVLNYGTPSAKYLRHLVAMPGGFMAGYLGNTVWFCEPYHPYAWPARYSQPVRGDIVALGVFGVTLVVLTTRGPVYMSGNSPDAISVVVLESNEVCQSPRSVVPVAGGVLFASQNGLCIATQSGVEVLTMSLFTKKEWQALQPEYFICEEMNSVVYISHTGGLVTGALHLPSMKLVRMDLGVTAWFSDFYTGELYAAKKPVTGQTAKAVKLLDGTGLRTARWRSKRITLSFQSGFAWMQVNGMQTVASPLNLNLYGYYVDKATGAEVEVKINTERASGAYSAVVSDVTPFRVQPGRYLEYEVEVSGTCRMSSVTVASTTQELQRVE